MKRIVFFVIVAVFAVSCKKEVEDKFQYSDTKFVYNQKLSLAVEAPISLPIGIPLPTPITISETGVGEVNDPLVQAVEDIQLKNMSVTITSPEGVEWDFLKHLEVYISYDTLPEIKLAHHYNCIDSIGNVLYLMPEENTVLDDYVRNSTFDMRMDVTVDWIPTADNLTLDADMNLDVKLVNTPK